MLWLGVNTGLRENVKRAGKPRQVGITSLGEAREASPQASDSWAVGSGEGLCKAEDWEVSLWPAFPGTLEGPVAAVYFPGLRLPSASRCPVRALALLPWSPPCRRG